jgi:hypothetical protein
MADIEPETVAGTAMQDENNAPGPAPAAKALPPSPSAARRASVSSVSANRIRGLSQRFMESSPPLGMWAATGETISKAPSLAEIRRGSYGTAGWDAEGQRRNSVTSVGGKRTSVSRGSSLQSPGAPLASQTPLLYTASGRDDEIQHNDDEFPAMVFGRGEIVGQSYDRDAKKPTPIRGSTVEDVGEDEEDDDLEDLDPRPKRRSKDVKAMLGGLPRSDSSVQSFSNTTNNEPTASVPNEQGVYPNGYTFPPKKTIGEATIIGLKALGKYAITPIGFLVVLYCLNVVAWGGMLFLLLCNASPQMCYAPGGVENCNDIDAPRRIWIEIDSQILNALFCVTGFGLIPWRFRDFYYLMKFRIRKDQSALRKLAGYHNGWFRLPGSEKLPVIPRNSHDSEDSLDNPALPLPLKKTPDPPLTGVRAPPTALWKMDYVIWAFFMNTILQGVLSGFMWGFSRYTRPSWSTGLFIVMAMVVAAMGGLMQFKEGKRIKNVEGIPCEEKEVLRDIEKAEEKKREKSKEKGKAGKAKLASGSPEVAQ